MEGGNIMKKNKTKQQDDKELQELIESIGRTIQHINTHTPDPNIITVTLKAENKD